MRQERDYVIEAIRAFLDGSGGQWDWDDFTSAALRSARLDDIRRRARAVRLPLDADGETALRRLIDEAEQLSADGRAKVRPWRMEAGMICGLIVGALLWWIKYLPGGGVFQNLQWIVVPAAAGILIVALRNRRKEIGYFDPEVIAENQRGRV